MLVLARLTLVLLALVSATWAFVRCYDAVSEAAIRRVARGIEAGESFQSETLASLEPDMAAAAAKPILNPDALHDIAVIRLRQAEIDLGAGASPSKAEAFERAESAARVAVALDPTDAFVWYALAWLAKSREGYSPTVERMLDMSYRTGPHEGWIAVRRNGFAAAMLGSLPQDLQTTVLDEFRDLVASNFINDAAAVLTGPGWPYHEGLLARLRSVPETERISLARRVAEYGSDISVPGVDRLPARPWK